MIISLIAAMDRNRLIGNNNQLPWHLPADFAHFKKVTMGKPIVMGRKTFESIGRPLPGRRNIVLSRDRDLQIEGVDCVGSFDEALAMLADVDEVMIIGGSSIYAQLLPRADRLYLTIVDAEFEGDAWFPQYEPDAWDIIEQREMHADEKNAWACRFLTLQRRS